ncbi:MAG: SDR family oxidoreductase [Rhodococcus sp.]|nr:SDR family oxidoreductase [Rhodococcus sp. (in: high G+C Gram-positive bacteria)]
MTTYVVTGGTGFLGRNVLAELLQQDEDAHVYVLVRPGSVQRLTDLAQQIPGGDSIEHLVGDLTEPNLGLVDPPEADHVLHLGAIYDLTAGEEQAATNVEGTRSVIDLARLLGATLHHVSSIAVAGDHRGLFDEDDFDLGQSFPTPYHRTKFEAEKLVRESGVRHRIYRPSAIVGNSLTGEIDKVDGPYYLFPAIAALSKLPHALPVAIPDLGTSNVVPVDYVARALVRLMAQPGLDGRTFHLANPKPQPIRQIYSALAEACGAPLPVAQVPRSLVRPFMEPTSIGAIDAGRAIALKSLGIPPALLDTMTLPTFGTEATRKALDGSGIEVPQFDTYAATLWNYWRENLDPNRARRRNPRGPLVGRHIVITGASSGIGESSAFALADEGATVLLLARRVDELDRVVKQIRADGGNAHAYPCDITDTESVDRTVATILDEHDHVDMLVNNAGRSIRRGIYHSTDRLHDYERTMAVNYFGAVRMILALLPQMRARRFGHIVNISSAGVQAATPRFSAYVASKSALDGFTDVAATETLSDGITFTTIHMPLVRTPMIAPTEQYNSGPATSPEVAARMVVRALVERPKRIDVALGTLADYGSFFAPHTKDLILHRLYKMFPDSPAARGEKPADTAPKPAKQGITSPIPPIVGDVVRKVGNLLPGVHW